MKTSLARRLFAIMASLLLLTATPALAGEWVDGTSDDETWKVLVYKGTFDQGEFANLYYKSGGKKDFGGDSRKQSYRLVMALNNGDEKITGFTGVGLADANKQMSLILSNGPYKNKSGDLVGSYDVAAHGGYVDRDRNKNYHACYRTYAALKDSTDEVRCESGEGRWIYVEVAGELKEEKRQVRGSAALSVEEMFEQAVTDTEAGNASGNQEFYSPGSAIRAANKLIIGAVNGNNQSFSLTIDEKFRRALWDEALWQK